MTDARPPRVDPADVVGPAIHALAMGYATAYSLLQQERAEWEAIRSQMEQRIAEMARSAQPVVKAE